MIKFIASGALEILSAFKDTVVDQRSNIEFNMEMAILAYSEASEGQQRMRSTKKEATLR